MSISHIKLRRHQRSSIEEEISQSVIENYLSILSREKDTNTAIRREFVVVYRSKASRASYNRKSEEIHDLITPTHPLWYDGRWPLMRKGKVFHKPTYLNSDIFLWSLEKPELIEAVIKKDVLIFYSKSILFGEANKMVGSLIIQSKK